MVDGNTPIDKSVRDDVLLRLGARHSPVRASEGCKALAEFSTFNEMWKYYMEASRTHNLRTLSSVPVLSYLLAIAEEIGFKEGEISVHFTFADINSGGSRSGEGRLGPLYMENKSGPGGAGSGPAR